MGVIEPEAGLYAFIEDGLILGFFDVVGRVFIASLKLLVVPLVMVSLICGMSFWARVAVWAQSPAERSGSIC